VIATKLPSRNSSSSVARETGQSLNGSSNSVSASSVPSRFGKKCGVVKLATEKHAANAGSNVAWDDLLACTLMRSTSTRSNTVSATMDC